ncbi:MAG: hypothetical protein ACLPIX_18885 [Rhodomicrobium sp.]
MRLWTKRRNAREHSFQKIGDATEFAMAAEGVTRIDLLKIDIEGFEDRASMPFFRKTEGSLWPKQFPSSMLGGHIGQRTVSPS